MDSSGDVEFDIWLRDADQDLQRIVGSETDVEAMLTDIKHHVAQPVVAASEARARAVGEQQPAVVSETRSWSKLSGSERTALTDAGRVRTWQPGEILALQGSPPSGMFVILHGWVRIIATDYERGSNVPLAVRGPAEIVGELAVISGLPRTATIQAIVEVRALAIPRERALAVLRDKPRIAGVLFRAVAIRLRQSDPNRVEGSQDFPQRLAAVLLELALQHEPGWETAGEIMLHVTQEDLASFARVSRSTLIRGLDAMKKVGLVQTRRHEVTILRPDLLRDLASGRAMLEPASISSAG